MKSVQKHRPAAIALGSNLVSPAGSPHQTVIAALTDIAALHGLSAVSRFYRTAAYPEGSGPDFVNAVAIVRTDLAAADLLASLHEIEARYGRERRHRWSARTLDLDLLLVGEELSPDRLTQTKWARMMPQRQLEETPESLVLPHPRMQDRAFVLVPLAEIAPEWRHPVTGRSVAEMAAALPQADKAAIRCE